MPRAKELSFHASESSGRVSALLLKPKNATCLLLFAHGAGADMRHHFMENASQELARNGIATLRYNFPFTEKGSRRPDPKPVLLATVRSAVALAGSIAEGLPIFAGGKSMGGRMTSLAASEEPLPRVNGLIFFGFPLHPAGEPSTERAQHLSNVKLPMLFLQGTRDALADLGLLKPVCKKLGKRATLFVIEEADHSFHVPKRTGRSDEDVLTELARTFTEWSSELISPR
ncbi:MAG: dienelactone hydrolase family protein [Bacteroidetes bacterium]|nr:dienelactone hydrolase family protein [Bacteroidota bacterium]MCW5894651.1 dienelactone hydrolase family protein [Bacteroidota bacterium]